MPKSKPGKHLKFYLDCIKTGEMPNEGLCLCVNEGGMGVLETSLLDLFIPNERERDDLFHDDHSRAYWGSGMGDMQCAYFQFTPLRQTIVLFMAAINNEL